MNKNENGYYIDPSDDVKAEAQAAFDRVTAAIDADEEITLTTREAALLHTVLIAGAHSVVHLMQEVMQLQAHLDLHHQAEAPAENPFNNPFKFGN